LSSAPPPDPEDLRAREREHGIGGFFSPNIATAALAEQERQARLRRWQRIAPELNSPKT